jgi:hypothetical protein
MRPGEDGGGRNGGASQYSTVFVKIREAHRFLYSPVFDLSLFKDIKIMRNKR